MFQILLRKDAFNRTLGESWHLHSWWRAPDAFKNLRCVMRAIFCVLDQSALIDASLGRSTPFETKRVEILTHAITEDQPSKRLWERNGSGQKFPTQPVDRSTPKLLRSFPAIHSIWSQHPNIMKRTLEVSVQLLTLVCLHGCHHGGFLSSFFIGQMCHGSGLPRLSLIALNAWFGRLWNALFTTCLQFMWLAFGLKRTPQNH